MKHFLLYVLISVFSSAAIADSWMPARPLTISSDGGSYRLTIYPRSLSGALPYFEDLVEGKVNPGQKEGANPRCEASLEILTGNKYELVWRKHLENDVAPISALVSNKDGSFVTFDNWHSVGRGPNTMVIYDSSGEVVRKFSLEDLLPQEHVESLPNSVSSTTWRTNQRLDWHSELLHLEIVDKNQDPLEYYQGKAKTIELAVNMLDGSVVSKEGQK
jgi:hypothetical protein